MNNRIILVRYFARIRVALIGVLLAAAFAPVAQAGTLFAANNTTNHLFTIDTDSLAVTDVGPFGVSVLFGGMAYDGVSGTLYLIGGRGNNNLYTVNQTTGAATLIGNHGIFDLFGLAYDSLNGVLYASQFCCQPSLDLFSLNVNDASATNIGTLSPGMGGLAYDSTNDRLVGIEDGPGNLFEINRANASTIFLAKPVTFVNDSGLTYDPDKDLFWDIDFNGRFRSFDPNSGFAATLHLDLANTWDGLAYKTTVILDTDGDGVLDTDDFCPDNTAIPESSVPTSGALNPNHWALTDADGVFDTVLKGEGKGPNRSYTIEDTAGCSCEEIIEILGLGDGHSKHGCSISAMDDFIETFVNP